MAGYKSNSNKSVAFLYDNLHNSHKQYKVFGVTLTKQEKDLIDKNFKSLKKEIKEDQKMERSPMLVDWQG